MKKKYPNKKGKYVWRAIELDEDVIKMINDEDIIPLSELVEEGKYIVVKVLSKGYNITGLEIMHDEEKALEVAKKLNDKSGYSETEIEEIISASMFST